MLNGSALADLERAALCFCQRLEGARGRDRTELVRELERDLGAIYASGTHLPEPHYQDAEEQAMENVQFLVQDVRRTMRKIQDTVDPDEELTLSPSSSPTSPQDEHHHEAWRTMVAVLREQWGERDRIWYVQGPADPDDREGNEASLSELLADVYVDMLAITSAAGAPPLGVRQARLAFDRHWGRKVGLLLFVLREVHDRLLREPDPLEISPSTSTH